MMFSLGGSDLNERSQIQDVGSNIKDRDVEKGLYSQGGESGNVLPHKAAEAKPLNTFDKDVDIF